MRARMRLRRPSPAMLVALVALLVGLGGTAGAAVIVSANSQVAPNTIAGAFAPAGANKNLIAGSVGGADLHAGSVSAGKLAPGIIGARAYGLVDGTTTLVSGRSKNAVSVTQPATGYYCVQLAPSVDVATAVETAGADYGVDGTGATSESVVEVDHRVPGGSCPANSFVVRTFYETVLNGSLSLQPAAEPFFFAVA